MAKTHSVVASRSALAILSLLVALAACGELPTEDIPRGSDRPMVSLGQNGTGIAVEGLTLGVCQTNGELAVSGTITVTNEGDVATEGLTLTPRIQYKTKGGPFEDLAGASQTIIPASQIDAGASETYAFAFAFSPVSDAVYRLAALVTITNHSGSLGVPKGPEPKAGFPDGAVPSCNSAVNPSPNTPPQVAITVPANQSVLTQGATVTFSGTASDAEQGDLSASIAWSSSVNGSLGTGSSVSSSALSVGVHTVTASVTDAGALTSQVSISIRINAAPVVTIVAPANASAFVAGANVAFDGTASDTEDGTISGSIAWSSSLDGSLGVGANVSTSALSVGNHTITASLTDSDGATGSASISVAVTAAVNNPPQVSITAPAPASVFTQGTLVTFTGTANDTEQGNLSASIAWSSNLNGSLGTGSTVNSSTLSVGTHTITASVTDNGGATGSADISITINAPPPPPPPPACTVAPAGFNKIWSGGSNTDWTNAANWTPSGVPAATDDAFICANAPNQPTVPNFIQTIDNLLVESGATLTIAASATLRVSGGATSAAGSLLTGTGTLRIDNTLTVGGSYSVAHTQFFGQNGQLIPVLPYQHLDIRTAGVAQLVGATTVTGNLLLHEQATGVNPELDLNGQTLLVMGNLSSVNGAFTMDQASDVLQVNGDASLIVPVVSPAVLTAGVMRVRGNYVTTCGGSTALNAGGTHLTVFDGTAAQTVYVHCPGASHQRFQELQVTNTSGVTFTSVVFVAGSLSVAGKLTVNVFLTLTVTNTFTLQNGSVLINAGTITAGTCVNAGGTVTNTGTISCTSGSL